MAKSYCIRHGQTEIGVIEHRGNSFAALGASVQGKHVTGYTDCIRGDVVLKTWCGKTLLGCRCQVVETYPSDDWGKGVALVFRLANGRAIVGYALDEQGSLFRGALVDDDFEYAAKQEAEHWRRIDAEDAEWFEYEQHGEDL
jgi:hypothetical protein